MFDLVYYMFYCSTGDADPKSKHAKVGYGMEIFATQILSFLTFIFVGALNIRVSAFLLWILIIGTNGVIAYFLINKYYIKSGRYNAILEKYSGTSKRTTVLYKIIIIFLFILSFILLIVGGMIMSYLFSLYE